MSGKMSKERLMAFKEFCLVFMHLEDLADPEKTKWLRDPIPGNSRQS